MKLKFILALTLLLAPHGSRAGETLSLDQVIREVLTNNASLKASRANWEAMRERVPQARAWADPRAMVDLNAARFMDMPPGTSMDYGYGLEQQLPITGRNRLLARAREAEAAAALGETRRRELDLVARARVAWYRLAGAREQLSVNRRNADLLRQFVEVTRAKYEVGTKPQADVLAAETELGKLEEFRFDIERQISDGESALNVLMNRPAQTPLGTMASLPPAAPPPPLNLADLEKLAREHRPELFIARQRVEAARRQAQIARRGWIPEPSLRVQGIHDNESPKEVSEVMVGLSFDLPFFNRSKYSAAIRESQKLLESGEHELAQAEADTLGLLRDAVTRVQTYHHHTVLFGDKIIPLARQNVTAARLSYETDKAGFLDLLNAQRTLQDAESMYWTHLTDCLSALAELEALVGVNPNDAPIATNPKHEQDKHHE